jgi:hypothetical protein
MINPPARDESKAGLWLALSIASTLLCCLPLGIPGIVYAAKAMGDAARGDVFMAHDNAAKARMWTLISAGVGLLVVLLAVCLGVLGADQS